MQQHWFFILPMLFSSLMRYFTFSPLNAPCDKFLNAIFMGPGGDAASADSIFLIGCHSFLLVSLYLLFCLETKN
jgi:hypothetical protein